jgi:hypothetical protein
MMSVHENKLVQKKPNNGIRLAGSNKTLIDYSLSKNIILQKSQSTKACRSELLEKSDTAVFRQKYQNFLANIWELQEQNMSLLEQGDFSEKKLFHHKLNEKRTSDLVGIILRDNKLSKDVSLSHSANIIEKRTILSFKMPQKKLFHHKLNEKRTSDLVGIILRGNKLSKDVSLSHSANIKNKRTILSFKMPQLEYSYFTPKMSAGTESIPKVSELKANKNPISIDYERMEPLQKTADPFHNTISIDINQMADKVYHLIEKKIQIEKERSGKWY